MDLQNIFEGQSNRWQRYDSRVGRHHPVTQRVGTIRSIEFHCSFNELALSLQFRAVYAP